MVVLARRVMGGGELFPYYAKPFKQMKGAN
jgi:hypothetical protein